LDYYQAEFLANPASQYRLNNNRLAPGCFKFVNWQTEHKIVQISLVVTRNLGP